MKKHPQTIQIFLPYGDPTDIRIAEITTLSLHVFEIPRHSLSKFFSEQESNQVALYCLFREDKQTSNLTAYIGQTGNLEERLKHHDKNKDFWNKILVFVSRTNNMTIAHATYLEYLAINTANQVGRYKLENSKSKLETHITASMKADCEHAFDVIKLLSSTLGFPIFKPLIEINNNEKYDNQIISDEDIYLCQIEKENVDAKMKWTTEGFVVLKGSRIRSKPTQSFKDSDKKNREKLEKDGIIKNCIFVKDYLFNSASAASGICRGTSSSGNENWRHKKTRKTLGQMIK